MTSSDKKTRSSKSSSGGRKKNPKRNYQRGADTERAIRKDLLGRGFPLVIRGAGSKSTGMKAKVDLVAAEGPCVLLVQAKPGKGKIPDAEKKELIKLAEDNIWCAVESWRERGIQYGVIYCSCWRGKGGPPEGYGCPLLSA